MEKIIKYVASILLTVFLVAGVVYAVKDITSLWGDYAADWDTLTAAWVNDVKNKLNDLRNDVVALENNTAWGWIWDYTIVGWAGYANETIRVECPAWKIPFRVDPNWGVDFHWMYYMNWAGCVYNPHSTLSGSSGIWILCFCMNAWNSTLIGSN